MPRVRFFRRTLCGEMQCSVTKLPLQSYYCLIILNGKPLGPHLIPSCSYCLASSVVSFVDRVLLITTDIRTSLLTSSPRCWLLVFPLVLAFLRLWTRLDPRFRGFSVFCLAFAICFLFSPSR